MAWEVLQAIIDYCQALVKISVVCRILGTLEQFAGVLLRLQIILKFEQSRITWGSGEAQLDQLNTALELIAFEVRDRQALIVCRGRRSVGGCRRQWDSMPWRHVVGWCVTKQIPSADPRNDQECNAAEDRQRPGPARTLRSDWW